MGAMHKHGTPPVRQPEELRTRMHPRGRSKIAPARIGRRRGDGPQAQGMRRARGARMPDWINGRNGGQGDGGGGCPHIAERQCHMAADVRPAPLRQARTARLPFVPARGEEAAAGGRPPSRPDRTGQARQRRRVHAHMARLPAAVGIGIAFADLDEPRQADDHAGQRHDRRRVARDHFPNCPPDLHAAHSLAHAAPPSQQTRRGNFHRRGAGTGTRRSPPLGVRRGGRGWRRRHSRRASGALPPAPSRTRGG